MSESAYKYLSDDGNIYRVSLPDDLASPFGYQAATGGEPYLPGLTYPRSGIYVSLPWSQIRSVILTEPFSSIMPPVTATIDGRTYQARTFRGEVREF